VKRSFDIHLQRKFFTSPKTWLAEFLSSSDKLKATILAVTFWHLWDARNKLREDGGTVHPATVAGKITAYVDLILNNLTMQEPDHRRETSRAVSWSPPPEGIIQLNVDAAIFASSC
jgi:hypothetical protein